jgi:hypothetical protein
MHFTGRLLTRFFSPQPRAAVQTTSLSKSIILIVNVAPDPESDQAFLNSCLIQLSSTTCTWVREDKSC